MSGTKRTRIPRTPTLGLISPQALSLYRHAVALRRRGADRETCHAAERDLDRLLGVRLWHVSIFDFDDIFDRNAPPAYMGDAEDWHRALQLRQQLEAADRELRCQERAARRAAKVIPEPEPAA